MARGNLSESLDVAGVSPNVHANDARRSRRDRLLHSSGIEGVSAQIDIAKNRRDSLPLKSVGRRDKGEGWDDHFTCHPQCSNRDLQRHRAIAHGNTVLHANQFGDSPLEPFYERTIVGKPARVENPVKAFEQSRTLADVGPADVEWLAKGWQSAKNRQVADSLLHQVLVKHQHCTVRSSFPFVKTHIQSPSHQSGCDRTPAYCFLLARSSISEHSGSFIILAQRNDSSFSAYC